VHLAHGHDHGRDGTLVARRSSDPNLTMLCAVFIQFSTSAWFMVHRPYLIEAFGEDSLHFALLAVSHRERSVWRIVPLIGLSSVPARQNLCRTLLPDDCGGRDFHRRKLLLTRDHGVRIWMKREQRQRRRTDTIRINETCRRPQQTAIFR